MAGNILSAERENLQPKILCAAKLSLETEGQFLKQKQTNKKTTNKQKPYRSSSPLKNVKRTSLSKKEKAISTSKKIIKEKISLVKIEWRS